jgi:multicomponent Na+:H+ antiporter subunit E
MALVAYGGGLVVIWVLAWGSPSVANVASGVAVAAVLLAVAPDTWPGRSRPRVRPVAIVRFAASALAKVVESNVVLTREVLSPRSRIHTGVVGVPLPECSDALLALMTNVMALTPGTMPLEVTREPTVIYVHVLHLHDVEDVRREVQQLAALAYRAFGSDAAVAALDDVLARPATGAPSDDRGTT